MNHLHIMKAYIVIVDSEGRQLHNLSKVLIVICV